MIARAALLALGIACAAARAEYTVVVDIAQPDELTATLKLPRAEGAPHRSMFAAPLGDCSRRIHSPACGGVPLKQQKNGTWIAEPRLPRGERGRSVQWSRSTDTPTSRNTRRCSSRSRAGCCCRRRRLLLRPTDDASGSGLRSRSARATPTASAPRRPESSRGACRPRATLPRSSSSGRIDPLARDRPFEVRYVADDPKRVETLGLEGLHEKALEYLARHPAAVARIAIAASGTLLVVWVGIDERRGRAGRRSREPQLRRELRDRQAESARQNAAADS
jgi:hypothetical protein